MPSFEFYKPLLTISTAKSSVITPAKTRKGKSDVHSLQKPPHHINARFAMLTSMHNGGKAQFSVMHLPVS